MKVTIKYPDAYQLRTAQRRSKEFEDVMKFVDEVSNKKDTTSKPFEYHQGDGLSNPVKIAIKGILAPLAFLSNIEEIRYDYSGVSKIKLCYSFCEITFEMTEE